MKVFVLAAIFGFIGGAALSYSQTAKHYEAKANELVKEQEKAEESRLRINKDVVDKLYEKYNEAITAEPVVIDRIVRVKANCPVQTDRSGTLDDARTPIEVELAGGVIRGVEQVAYKHKKKYETCALQLRATQAKLASTQISLD